MLGLRLLVTRSLISTAFLGDQVYNYVQKKDADPARLG